ncbi:MAG: VOC family protein [Actinobacteria bacterium]|nr:VOC family protein [Actinomycetota bacterium]
MTLLLRALSVDALDPAALARFWSGLLGWQPGADRYGATVLVPGDDTGFQLRFLPTRQPKTEQNQLHFDLTSESLDDQRRTVAKALELGARPCDVGQRPDEPHVVLADPEGNEFCVIEPGNGFLAGCGFVGAVACDGSRATGYFWSAALGWPLVWDQDEETAIRSPHGGPKISWGGPPLSPKTGKYRLHFDLAPADGSDQAAEVERLLSLGARRTNIGQGEVDWVVLTDPDGHEFCVWPG